MQRPWSIIVHGLSNVSQSVTAICKVGKQERKIFKGKVDLSVESLCCKIIMIKCYLLSPYFFKV